MALVSLSMRSSSFSLGFGGKNIPAILNLLKLRRKIGKTSAEVHA